MNNRQPAGKRYASRLRSPSLQEDQLKAYKGIKDFLFDKGSRFATLTGKAGTGKTFLNSVLIESILVENHIVRIAVCAPTHKAVKVLREQCDFYHERMGFLTIHSLLGVEQSIDSFGNQVFKPNYEGSKVKDYSIIICDEYSMLADELVDALYEHKSVKVLFVGDINQIPPVGLEITKVAKPEIIELWDIKEFTLTKIMRQAEGNPIIKASTDIIEGNYNNPETDLLEDGTGIEYLNTRENDQLPDLLTDYFSSREFAEDSDYVKVIAWTNKMVKLMNKHIRYMLYDTEADNKIVIGEKLIADKPIKEDGKIIFNTNQEFEVTSFYTDTLTIGADNPDDSVHLKHYVVDVDYYTSSGRLYTCPVKILHEDSEAEYNDIIAFLRDQAINCIAYGGTNEDRKAAWRNYYDFQEIFAQVKYNYAISAHKSQGSTYMHTFIMTSDIWKNPNHEERKRIFYTAVTRAKNKVYLVS